MFKELENFITSRIVEMETINVLNPGYILTSDKKCINIYEGDSHKNVFNAYINVRLKNKEFHNYSLLESLTIIANEFSDIIYLGPRSQDIKQLVSGGSEFRLHGFFLPDDRTNINCFQKEAIQILENTNHSIFRPDASKIELNYFTISTGYLLTKEEIKELRTISLIEKDKEQVKKI